MKSKDIPGQEEIFADIFEDYDPKLESILPPNRHSIEAEFALLRVEQGRKNKIH